MSTLSVKEQRQQMEVYKRILSEKELDQTKLRLKKVEEELVNVQIENRDLYGQLGSCSTEIEDLKVELEETKKKLNDAISMIASSIVSKQEVISAKSLDIPIATAQAVEVVKKTCTVKDPETPVKPKKQSTRPKPPTKVEIENQLQETKRALEETKKQLEIADQSKPSKKKVIPKKIKTLVWNMYIGEDQAKSVCLCCKKTEIKMMDFQCAHFVSEYNGGETSVENLRPICSGCNLSMSSKNMDEFMKDFKL
jgi:HNH endonuclease